MAKAAELVDILRKNCAALCQKRQKLLHWERIHWPAAAMLKAGANEGATGENAIVQTSKK